MKFARGAGSEGRAPNTNLTHLLDDVTEDVLNQGDQYRLGSGLVNFAYLDSSEGRTGEFQSPLYLEPA